MPLGVISCRMASPLIFFLFFSISQHSHRHNITHTETLYYFETTLHCRCYARPEDETKEQQKDVR